MTKPDLINAPPHYIGKSGTHAIDVIEDFGCSLAVSAAVVAILEAAAFGEDDRRIDEALAHIATAESVALIAKHHGQEAQVEA